MDVIALALHEWIRALLAASAAVERVRLAKLADEPCATVSGCVAALGALCGLQCRPDVDMRTLLRMAAAFSDAPGGNDEAEPVEGEEEIAELEARMWTTKLAVESATCDRTLSDTNLQSANQALTGAETAMLSTEGSRLPESILAAPHRLDSASRRLLTVLLASINPNVLRENGDDLDAALAAAYPVKDGGFEKLRSAMTTARHAVLGSVTADKPDLVGMEPALWPRLAEVVERLPDNAKWLTSRPELASTMAGYARF